MITKSFFALNVKRRFAALSRKQCSPRFYGYFMIKTETVPFHGCFVFLLCEVLIYTLLSHSVCINKRLELNFSRLLRHFPIKTFSIDFQRRKKYAE